MFVEKEDTYTMRTKNCACLDEPALSLTSLDTAWEECPAKQEVDQTKCNLTQL